MKVELNQRQHFKKSILKTDFLRVLSVIKRKKSTYNIYWDKGNDAYRLTLRLKALYLKSVNI